MSFEMNRVQRFTLFAIAVLIIFVQFAQFSDNGIDGYGWVFSFFVAAILSVVASSQRIEIGLSHRKKEMPAPRHGEAELKRLHQSLRDNADILAVEAESAAKAIAKEVEERAGTAVREFSKALDNNSAKENMLAAGLNNHILQMSMLLMLGLIGIRRSKGKVMYITGIEYKALQEHVVRQVVNLAVVSHHRIAKGENPSYEAMAQSIQKDSREVTRLVIRYCKALEENVDYPESELMNWYESRTGVSVADSAFVRRALNEDVLNKAMHATSA